MTFDDAGRSTVALWWAAADDDAGAVHAVKRAAGTLADQGVTAVGLLAADLVIAHGLRPGEAIPAKR